MVAKTLSLAPWRVCLPLCLFLSSGSHVTPSRDVTTTPVNTMGTRRLRAQAHDAQDLMEMTPTSHPVVVHTAKVKVWAARLLLPLFFIFYHHVAETCCKPHSCRPKLSAHLQLRASWFASSAPPTERLLLFFSPPPLRTYIICKWYVVSFKKINNKKKSTLMLKNFPQRRGC